MAEPILPQRPMPARAEVLSVDWLFEPFWPGMRAVARWDGAEGTTWDERGAALSDGGALIATVGSALRATSAIVDVVRTDGAGVVAVDLLELDGEPLLDVPFQERRRLLESALSPSSELRIGPLVKHPVGGWLGTWRSEGFVHYVAKRQNARYAPGEMTDDWLKLGLRADVPVGVLGHLVGSRERIRRIRD
jgi:bifunctional non-homologous end joining protein LigD